jgi:hypothetical protein
MKSLASFAECPYAKPRVFLSAELVAARRL